MSALAVNPAQQKALDMWVDFVRRYRGAPVEFVQEVMGAEPDVWQGDFLRAIARGDRRISARSGHGVGKMAPKSLILNTPEGVKRWGDLQPGDLLFGGDGSQARIVSRHEQGVKPIYRVTFDDGSSTLCGLEHLWNVRGRRERRNGLSGWRTLTTADILEIGVTRANGAARARQWEIPIQGPAQFNEREIDIHPYLVGLWLGDGTKGEPAYTKPFPEIVDRLRSLGYEVSENGKRKRVLGISHLFTDPVFALGSPGRYIPDDYKFNTAENRLELLRGLLDSDGEVHGHSGTIGYSSTSERLIQDVIWLVRSLGGKAQLQPTAKNGWYPGENGQRIECRDCYRATINLPFNPFTLEHRRAAWKPSEDRYLARWIDSIEYSHDEEAMCVTVDRPDGLYLANDFIVTHNSTVVAWAIIWYITTRYPCKIVVTAPTTGQLYDALFAETKRWLRALPPALAGLFEVTTEKIVLKSAPDESFVSARTSRIEKPEALQGVHSEHVMLVADEASGVPEAVFEAASGSMSGHNAVTLLLGNPVRSSGFFYDTFHRLSDRWTTFHISCLDSARCSADYIQDQKDRYGEDSNAYRIRVLGEFPLSDDDTVIPMELIELATMRDVQPTMSAPEVWGLDVARFGSDSSALVKRKGNWVEDPRVWRGLDLMQTSGVVYNEFQASKVKPVEILVDSIGLGAGVVDRLRELKLPVRGINVSESPAMAQTYVNLRAELWFSCKEWLARRDCKIPKDERLISELAGVRFTFTSNGKIQVEAKDAMRKRGRGSPDCADSLCLTFASNAATGLHGWSHSGDRMKALFRNIKGIV